MSLLPLILSDSYFRRPSRILDQRFGDILESDDLLQPVNVPRMMLRYPSGYLRNWKSASSSRDVGSTVDYGKDEFLASLDVQQFKPEELSVKLTGENSITIEGKHEEKEDEHGHIYRHFVRTYIIPKQYDVSRVGSKLSSDGVLSITAPRIIEEDQVHFKTIPITQTGEPAKLAEKKEGEKKSIEKKDK
uniref:SHSP21.5 n=1 Tax=Agasicles hygrophila TaxID=715812 RepID=A0A5C1DA25_9CUCU|nr:small heat shock protein 21 [Agasicles hygrophila]QNJ44846.1 sHSP21.5 [Agasicles hygrophila]